jgi:hypothetical protein
MLPDGLVTVVQATWHSSSVLGLTYKDSSGIPRCELLYRSSENNIEIVSAGLPWSFDADGSKFRLVIAWSAVNLRIELDNLLWKEKNHIDVKILWEYLCTYLYRPRLANEDVFSKAITEGLRSKDYFGYADKVDDNGRYLGLVFGTGR